MYKAFLLIHTLVVRKGSETLTPEQEQIIVAQFKKTDDSSIKQNSQSITKEPVKKPITPREF